MTARRLWTVVGLLALALPAGAAAQGLGDTAARQREKRAKEAQAKKTAAKETEAKVFTNDDLAAGRPPDAKPSGATAAPSPAPESTGGGESAPAQPDRLADEKPYLEAIRAAQANVASTEARIQALSAKLNPMSGSFIYGSQGSNSANEEAQVRAALSQAEAQLLEARRALAAANQSMQEFRRRAPSPSSNY